MTLILLILWEALNAYAPKSEVVRDIGWLANKSFVNPHLIWTTMRLSLAYSNRKGFLEQKKPEDQVYFYLHPGVFYLGYRFFFQITDKTGKEVFFCSFGPVRNGKNIRKIMGSNGKIYYQINLGSMPLGLVKNGSLRMTIFVFAPAYSWEETSPFVMSLDLDPMERGVIPAGFSTADYVRPERSDKGIVFKGSGSDINRLRINQSAKDSLVNFELFSLVASNFKFSEKVQTYYDLEGKLLDKLSSPSNRLIRLLNMPLRGIFG